MVEALVDALLRDLVEEDAPDLGLLVGVLDDLGQVVGDGLALAIGVGREQDALDLLRARPDVLDDLVLALLGEAKVEAAEYPKPNAELQYKQAQNNAVAEIEAAYTEYLKTQKSLQYYKSSGLPNAELITKQSTIAFQKGEINYAQHVLNLQQADEIKQNYLQTLLEYNQSVIALEFLSGSIK